MTANQTKAGCPAPTPPDQITALAQEWARLQHREAYFKARALVLSHEFNEVTEGLQACEAKLGAPRRFWARSCFDAAEVVDQIALLRARHTVIVYEHANEMLAQARVRYDVGVFQAAHAGLFDRGVL